jgi:hemolysin III
VAFLVAGRLPFHNTIWHVFVLAATMVFFIAICLHLADTSG